MCEYLNATLEDTLTQSMTKESLFPESCAAACADRKWCLGVTDDTKTKWCIYHMVTEEEKGPSFRPMKPGKTLYLKKKYNGAYLSVRISYT